MAANYWLSEWRIASYHVVGYILAWYETHIFQVRRSHGQYMINLISPKTIGMRQTRIWNTKKLPDDNLYWQEAKEWSYLIFRRKRWLWNQLLLMICWNVSNSLLSVIINTLNYNTVVGCQIEYDTVVNLLVYRGSEIVLIILSVSSSVSSPLASYQIRKIAGCACAGNAKNVFPTHRLQRKPLFSDHGTYVTHVPWCMSGSLTCGGGENVPAIPGACAPVN